MKVLLVEDQRHMAYAIEHFLSKNKITVDIVFDGESGLEYALSSSYDVIILDVMLPKIDGFTILKKLREEHVMTPVIMLTAKGEIDDKLYGFENGADDYLTKPFESEELLARIKSLFRRNGDIVSNILEYKNISLNCENLLLKCGEKSYTLTVKESQILEMFLKKPEVIVAKEVILSKLWSYDKIVCDNNVEVYISFLRKKLDSFDTGVKIKTVRGIGYKLVSDSYV